MKAIVSVLFLTVFYFSGIAQPAGTDYRVEHAIRAIKEDYGDRVRIKPGIIRKFGENGDISTSAETLWQVGGDENYPSISEGNAIYYLSSSSTSDTQVVQVEGKTINPADSSITSVNQSVTLTGRTPVALGTSLYRINRIYNDSNSDLVGNVYAYRQGTTVTAGVPQEADSIHMQVEASYNQSHKAAVTLNSYDYWLITEIIISVESSGNQTRRADCYLEVRNFNKVFRRIVEMSASNEGGSVEMNFDPPLVIPPRSDVRMTAIASGTGTEVAADINGYLATTQ